MIKKLLKKIIAFAQWFLFTVLVLVILLLVSTAFNPVKSFRILKVMSGSMEPTIKVGSIVFTQKIDSESLKKGEIITYTSAKDPSILITHRLVAIEKNKDKPVYKTKGDANNSVDTSGVSPSQIIGRVIFSVPFLGYLSDWIRKPLGFILLIILPAIIIIISEIFNIKKAIQKEVEKKFSELEKKSKNKTASPLVVLIILLSGIGLSQVGLSGANFFDKAEISGSSFSAGCWAPPSIPTLVSPSNNTISGLNSAWDLNPVMDWSDSTTSCPLNTTIQYVYELYLDSNLSVLAYRSGLLSSSFIPAPGTPEPAYWWRVKACDSYNHCSDWSSAWKLTVDRTAPTTPGKMGWTTENPPIGIDFTSGSDFNDYFTCGNVTNKSTLSNFWGPSTDSLGSITYNREVYTSETATTPFYTTSLSTNYQNGTFPYSGIYWVHVQAQDSAGNKSGWTQRCSVAFDNIPPTLSVGQGNNNTPPNTSPIHDAYYSNSPISIFVTVQDANLSGYHLRIIKDGESEAHSCGASLTDASNQGYGKCGYRYNLTSTTGEQRNNEAIATVSASLLGGDGTYWVIIGAIDKAGNRTKPDYLQDPRVRILITSDSTKPTSIITTPSNPGSNSTVYTAPTSWDGIIAGTAADAGSGVAQVRLSILNQGTGLFWNGSSWIVGTEGTVRVDAIGSSSWSYTLAPAPLGTYTVTVHAIDNAGNVEDSYVLTIISDAPITTPELSLSLSDDKKTVSFSAVNIEGTVSLSYELTYFALDKERGIMGSGINVSNQSEYVKKDIDLATCSGTDCTYDQNITKMKLTVTLTDKDGKVTEVAAQL